MTQDHVLSHKKSLYFGHGTSSFLVLKVYHLVSKSLYYPTANPNVVKVPGFKLKLVFKFRCQKIYFEIDDVILVRSLPNFKFWKNDTFCIDDSNCE